MIGSLKLKFGRTPGSDTTTVPVSTMTIFIGPNNSGKSRILLEIFRMAMDTGPAGSLIVSDFEFNPESTSKLGNWMKENLNVEPRNLNVGLNHAFEVPNQVAFEVPNHYIATTEAQFDDAMTNPNEPGNKKTLVGWSKMYSKYLTGEGRMEPTKDQKNENSAAKRDCVFILFRDEKKLSRAREMCFKAFRKYLVIDPATNLGILRTRYSEDVPPAKFETDVSTAASKFYETCDLAHTMSDGVKSFTGIVMEILGGTNKMIVIDEPEAYLHPTLAKLLGSELGKLALEDEKQVFVSTHSNAFLMGCIEAGIELTIVRLTYENKMGTARVLPPDALSELMKRPILRSNNVLSALFYKNVIVVEGDSDRAFYQEINERLLHYKPEWGIPDCLFINGNGKDIQATIVEPLRRMGIATAVISDFDLIGSPGSFSKLLSSCFVPTGVRDGLNATKSGVCKAATGKKPEKLKGVLALVASEAETALQLINQLSAYGIFVVPNGDVESWLPKLGVARDKQKWLRSIFVKMGENMSDPTYILPGNDDVWQFMSGVKKWLENPIRNGVPE